MFMARDTVVATPISTRDELVAWMEKAGGKKGDAPFGLGDRA